MNPRPHPLRIGEVATSSGITVGAVRYYERMGLLSHDARTSGGFRTYSADIIERLSFIRQAQSLGLRLRDIRELLGARGHRGRQNCERVRALLEQRLADVEAQMSELETFRRTLRTALESCDSALTSESVDECPMARSLTSRRKR